MASSGAYLRACSNDGMLSSTFFCWSCICPFRISASAFCEGFGIFSMPQIIITEHSVRRWIVTQLLFGVRQNLFRKRVLPLSEIETREPHARHGGLGREACRCLKFFLCVGPPSLPLVEIR